MAPDQPTVELMRQALHYEKTKQGPAGRALLSDDFHHLGLRRRDRLEPTRGLPDVGDFEFRRLPLLATFWRRSCETSARHRNPIFGPATGVSVQNIGIDWLHILSLGVIQLFLMNLIWDLVHSNVMNITGSMQNVFEITINRIKGELNESLYGGSPSWQDTHQVPTIIADNVRKQHCQKNRSSRSRDQRLLGILHICTSSLAAARAATSTLLARMSILGWYPRCDQTVPEDDATRSFYAIRSRCGRPPPSLFRT